MLKIKDNVDLKELEKYGFKSYKDGYYKKWYGEPSGIYVYEVHNKTKKIIISLYSLPYNDEFYDTEIDSTLYDLIKADLVEKEE